MLRTVEANRKIMTPSFPGVVRKRIPYRCGRLSFVVMCLLGAAAFVPTTAFALPPNCTPTSGENVTVTCINATVDQGPGPNTGYGNGLQNGLTINVQAGASGGGHSTRTDRGGQETPNHV